MNRSCMHGFYVRWFKIAVCTIFTASLFAFYPIEMHGAPRADLEQVLELHASLAWLRELDTSTPKSAADTDKLMEVRNKILALNDWDDETIEGLQSSIAYELGRIGARSHQEQVSRTVLAMLLALLNKTQAPHRLVVQSTIEFALLSPLEDIRKLARSTLLGILEGSDSNFKNPAATGLDPNNRENWPKMRNDHKWTDSFGVIVDRLRNAIAEQPDPYLNSEEKSALSSNSSTIANELTDLLIKAPVSAQRQLYFCRALYGRSPNQLSSVVLDRLDSIAQAKIDTESAFIPIIEMLGSQLPYARQTTLLGILSNVRRESLREGSYVSGILTDLFLNSEHDAQVGNMLLAAWLYLHPPVEKMGQMAKRMYTNLLLDRTVESPWILLVASHIALEASKEPVPNWLAGQALYALARSFPAQINGALYKRLLGLPGVLNYLRTHSPDSAMSIRISQENWPKTLDPVDCASAIQLSPSPNSNPNNN